MLSIVDNSLRAVNFVFLIIILGLTGNLIATQDKTHSRVNFALFASVFGIVADSLYGVCANFISALAWPVIVVCLDFLGWVFTFSAGTALAVGIRGGSCGRKSFVTGNAISEGSTDRCRKTQASLVFLYFSFAIFLVKFVMSILNAVTSGAFGSRGSSRKAQVGVPTIAQV